MQATLVRCPPTFMGEKLGKVKCIWVAQMVQRISYFEITYEDNNYLFI
jgi:hypothetical protein